MNLYNTQLNKAFQSKSVLKIITGINNTNIGNVLKIAKAAELSRATYLDVAANVKLVKILKSSCSLPICTSSINPIDLYNCVLAGADLVEIGNYDFFYNQGIYLTAEQIVNLVLEVKSMVESIDICVTIPYHITWIEQVYLAQKLEAIGVSIIQTEGISRFYKAELVSSIIDISSLIDTSIPTLLSTYSLSQFVNIPTIASSGFKNILAPIAYSYGASGIGFGSSLQQQNDVNSIIKYINQAHKLINSLTNLEVVYNVSNSYSKLNKVKS